MKKSSLRFHGALAIERDHVGALRLRPELAEKRGHLAAMIAAMIDEMLQHLPGRLLLRIAFYRLVCVDAHEIGVAERRHEIGPVAFDFSPTRVQTGVVEGLEVRREA